MTETSNSENASSEQATPNSKEPWSGHVESIKIVSYRSFTDIEIPFSPGLNIISGANGIGKSSILYLLSNAFQRPVGSLPWMEEVARNKLLSGFSKVLNLKVEQLIRDSKYSDPSLGTVGTLFTVRYEGGRSLDFRRHNSKQDARHRLIPYYSQSKPWGLPSVPAIYLGLSRLSAPGEIDDQIRFKKRHVLSDESMEELKKAYSRIARLKLLQTETGSWDGGKLAGSFDTTTDGVDSNTVSAGQDNVFVILYAFQALKEYATKTEKSPSVLLIDEFDATLHPAMQIDLMSKLRKESKDWNIRVFFTSHSFNVLEEGLRHKDNILYFRSLANGSAELEQEPSMASFRMDLSTLTRDVMSIEFLDKESNDFLDTESMEFLDSF
ncbi:AAA family ATPase [Corynebacterium gottingense]|uniref:ATPase AAA-type core domain-containing protein n=1 Tax=Corynebacterium gottingense TaxID=2041036 RepID=A0ABX9UI43_9CORY|nr:AAA family ATPase [Corynebacterium gottingense]RMD17947.1 hypothetical protein EAW56_10325 [Corynebacterium gottingense]WJZ14226.1 recombination protein F [Corynebacterium gottingense]WJZ16539.1 recombination protein F [Corynebacterium gottingense]